MASLKDIRKRIGSVKNTQKITRAMKLVAAARLRKDAHPLLAERSGDRIQLIVMTSDRGLAGGFNAQLNRKVTSLITDEWADKDVQLRIVGRKGNDYCKRRYAEQIIDFRNAPTGDNALEFARELTNSAVDDFLEDKTDRIVILYNEFVSAMTQSVTPMQLLPVEPVVHEEGEEEAKSGDFLYEPSKQELLDHLVPLAVQNSIFRSCLESIASELGARMSAMDAATNNAGDMIGRLTLQYNRARQAAITTELTEIVSGAESLKG
jgi:F-type H+-transporting ATPase subunit gamma